eukprot:14403891-Alexandrium_andersonii.AAC.1
MAGMRFTVAFLVAWSSQRHRGPRMHSEAAGLAWYMEHTQVAQLMLAGPESPDGGLGGWPPSCTDTRSTQGAQL